MPGKKIVRNFYVLGIFVLCLAGLVSSLGESVVAGTCSCTACWRESGFCGYAGETQLPNDCDITVSGPAFCPASGCQGIQRTSGCVYLF